MGEGGGSLTREGSAVFGEVSISREGTLTGGGLPSSLSLLHEKVSPLSAWCVVTDYFENSSLLSIALVGMGLILNPNGQYDSSVCVGAKKQYGRSGMRNMHCAQHISAFIVSDEKNY